MDTSIEEVCVFAGNAPAKAEARPFSDTVTAHELLKASSEIH